MTSQADELELGLAGLAADLIEEITAARFPELSGGAAERVLGPREHEVARHANPDYARLKGIPPLDSAAQKWCSYCGNSKESELVPGPDHEHGFSDWMCKDSLDRHCQARHERRWPPAPEKAEPIVMKLARMQDDAQAARQQQGQPHQQEHGPAGQQEAPAGQQAEPPQTGYRPPVPGWSFSPYGSIDPLGNFHPAPQYGPYAHTLMNPQHRTHLLSGQSRPHYYGGPHLTEGADMPQDGQQPQRDTSTGIPPYGVPEGVRQALDGDHASGDIPVVQSAAAPVVRRPPRDRYGNRYKRLKYTGRR